MENKEESCCSDELCYWTYTWCHIRKDALMSKILLYTNHCQPSVYKALEKQDLAVHSQDWKQNPDGTKKFSIL